LTGGETAGRGESVAAGKHIDVFHYPDVKIELRADGDVLPYTTR
jgi:hypothetical protein